MKNQKEVGNLKTNVVEVAWIFKSTLLCHVECRYNAVASPPVGAVAKIVLKNVVKKRTA